MKDRFKTFLIFLTTGFLLGLVGVTFWVKDWQYAQPTPKPKFLTQISIGARPALPDNILTSGSDRPILLHFFNPRCPCSRFNLDHIRELQRDYGRSIRFVAVLQGEEGQNAAEVCKRFGLDMEAVPDATGAIAKVCGVYSTPQAVLLDRQGRLFYRGNYNSGRYCSNLASEYARIAMDALLAGRRPPAFPAVATRAYGCSLPSNR